MSTPTDPRNDREFYDRLKLVVQWINHLASLGKPVTALKTRAGYLYETYRVNRVRAARELDRTIVELAAIR